MPATIGTGPVRVAERRVTSVLFGDLVGFTTLSEQRDPDAVRELLSTYFDRCRTVIARYGGTIEKFIGDAVMAVWGVPTATDDDAERAVRAGRELIAAVREFGSEHGAPDLAMRVGVVTGEVAVTLGSTEEGMVAGDTVNTAARVQSLATPNQVWVDEQTREMTTHAIAYRAAGSHTLKGKALPLELWEVNGIAPDSAAGVAVPLVGYARELGLLKSEFQAARASSSGRMLLLVGDPGTGKTRLGSEFEEYADELAYRVRWHRGRCLAFGDGVAYSALVGAVRGRIGAEDTDDVPTLVTKLHSAVAQWVPDPEEAAWITPRLETLLGLSSGSYERDDLFAAWQTWFERLGADGAPVVWLVDDLHAADGAFLELVDHLVRASAVALFVIGLARPEILEEHPEVATGRRTTTVHLEGLSEPEMAELFAGLVDGLAPAARDVLVERSAGVPLYAIEIVRSLIDRGLTLGEVGRLRLREDADPEQILDPATTAGLQVLITSRLDLLGEERRTLLQDAAVIGQTFSAQVLAAASGRDEQEVASILDELVARDLLTVVRERLSADDGQYAFVQTPVRQVAYQMLARRDRRIRHLAAADALEPLAETSGDLTTIVAEHLVEALRLTGPHDPGRDGLVRRVRRWQIASAERVRALGALGEALVLYGRVIDELDDPEEAVRLHLVAAEIAFELGNPEIVVQHATAVFESGHAGADDEAQARMWAANATRILGRLEDAERILTPYATADALDGVNDVIASFVAGAWAAVTLEQGRAEESARWDQVALLRAEAADDARATYLALNSMALNAQQAGTRALQDALLEAGLRFAREHGLRRELVQALVNRSDALISVDPKRAFGYATEALDLALASGMAGIAAYGQTNLMLVQYVTGAWDELTETASRRPAADGLDSEERLYDYGAVVALQNLVATARGSEAVAPPTWEELDPTSGGQHGQILLMHLGTLAAARGDDRQAIGLLRRSFELAGTVTGISEEAVLVWTLAIERAVATGDLDVARSLLAELDDVQVLRERHHAERLRLSGTVAAADPSSDPALVEADLRAAVSELSDFGAPPSRARAEATLGRWLGSRGRADEADALLLSAAGTFRELGATRWLDEFGLADRTP
ncbi:adenylate/guanylate cyclase domain-containing protein [Mumia flava]|uniref:adenylate/guanylate cyclase domain-containing protein n=1 Tax=Mumia flava TaxID=1348852 RepID=UPI001FE2A342|nr:adenylate/guanylate cyclase domain-containing protein [Mumia flava]